MTVPASSIVVLTAFNLDAVRFGTRLLRGFSTFLYTGQMYFLYSGRLVTRLGLRAPVASSLMLLLSVAAGVLFYWIYLWLRHTTGWKLLRYAV